MTSPPSRECTHLYKILTPQEHNALPQRAWKGTEFDVRRARPRAAACPT
jgi:hypothetical protein